MPDIGFKDRHVEPILSGEKPITLRRAWKLDRTPDLGARLGLVSGWRTPQRRRFGTAVIVARATVWIGEEGLVAFTDWRTSGFVPGRLQHVGDNLARLPSVERLRRASEITVTTARAGWVAGSQALAVLDGFPDFAAMRAFHAAHRAEGADPVIRRELIGFGGVSREFG